MLGFEGAGARQFEVVGLRRAQRRQFDAEFVEMQGGDLLIEVLEAVDQALAVAAENVLRLPQWKLAPSARSMSNVSM
jgi:hypothetical protein